MVGFLVTSLVKDDISLIKQQGFAIIIDIEMSHFDIQMWKITPELAYNVEKIINDEMDLVTAKFEYFVQEVLNAFGRKINLSIEEI
jgi:hypothetical protein